MFRMSFFVEDKNLAPVMHAVTGRVLNLETMPVVNAENEDGKVKAPTNGTLLALFAASVKKAGLRNVTPDNLKAFCVSVGRAESAYTGLRSQAQEVGLLKKSGAGSRARYAVNGLVLNKLVKQTKGGK